MKKKSNLLKLPTLNYVLLGEKRKEDNMMPELGIDTTSGFTQDKPSDATPGTPSDVTSDLVSDTLFGTINPLPVTQTPQTLANSTVVPKTGDDNDVTDYALLLLVGVARISIASIGITGRRRRVSSDGKW